MTMLHKMDNQIFEIECKRASFYKGYVVYTERGLKLSLFKKVVEYDIGYRILFQIINHTETIAI